jgi:uncharacterized membrane protein
MSLLVKRLLVAIAFVLILDAIWISSQLPSYQRITESIQGMKMSVRWLPALITYGLIILGLYLILLYSQREPSNLKVTLFAFCFGLVSYGIYNFTNLSILNKYTWGLATKDTLWGAVLLSVSIGLALYLIKS